MAALKKQYLLEGLCCGNCAVKIEREVGKLNGITKSSIDFVTKTLTLEAENPASLADFETNAASIAKQHDPDIVIREVDPKMPGKRIIYLMGLSCADCAQKIQHAVSAIAGVTAVSVDVITQKMTIDAYDKDQLPSIIRQASQIALNTEPDIKISYSGNTNAQSSSGDWKRWINRILLITGAAVFFTALLAMVPHWLSLSLYLASYLLVGGDVVLRAIRNVLKGQVFDENFLMSIATIGAFAIGDFPEGVAVMLFYQVGELFQHIAVDRSRRSITSLMDIRPDFANLKTVDDFRRVAPEEVGIGELIVVKPGEKIPLDGRVVEGRSALDTSALTGESMPRDVEPGSEVLSGSINKSGLLTIQVLKEFSESTVSRILDLVQNTGSKKSHTENFITKFARYYTPVVVFAALALAVIPPLVVSGATFADWIHRALVFLVVSCPCALVISIPLSFFGGIGGASKNGILVKGSNYLEALNDVDTVIFDKTGTLTKGVFKVTQLVSTNDWTQDELLKYAAYAESYSNHPIAASIQKAYGREVDVQAISEHEEISGQGVRVKVNGKPVLAGNDKLMTAAGLSYQKADALGTVVYLAVDGIYAGYIVISDEIKPDSRQAVQELKENGVRIIAMLTGDSAAVSVKIAQELGLDAFYSNLLPHQKVEQLEELMKKKTTRGKVVFVGDGINDAPVLARSDVGIAMGGLGSDAAIEAADVVLMTDEPVKLVTAIRVAKKTRNIVLQNIVFALGVKAVILVLGALGIATMWEAVFGDVGVAVIAILNAMRALRVVKL